jgi:iron complex outermembrane receptor protein
MSQSSSHHRRLFGGASLILLTLAAAPALAQSAAPAPAGGTIEEVVVTAQRRSERLQDVPVSVQVVSGAAIAAKNQTSLESLAQTTPSLTATKGGATNFLQVRGVGSGGSQGFDQSVATFIDDIYHGRSRSSATTFLDLDRIEVLKGPQSTFFGANAIAGALNIVTNKPSQTYGGSARALYGDNGQFALEGAVGGPISSTLAVRLAATYNGSDGFLKDINTKQDTPRERNMGGRISFAWTPSDNLDDNLKIEASRTRQKGDLNLQLFNCPPPAPFALGSFCRTALAAGVPNNFSGDTLAQSAGTGVHLDNFEAVNALNYRFGDGLTLTAVTGYYNYVYDQNLDLDAQPAVLANTNAPESYQQLSQEIRLASASGQRLEWMVGAYAQKDHLAYHQDANQPFRNGGVQANAALAALIPYLPLGQAFHYKQDEESYSLFGSVTYALTEQLKISGGLRASWVHKDYNRDLFYAHATRDFGGFDRLPANLQALAAQVFGAPASVDQGRRNDQAVMPSVRLQYQPSSRIMAYASYSKGFKAGGFNGSDATGNAANIPFQPEHVNAYEAGLKSELFDRRLLLNLAAFRSDYRDLQVTVREGYQTGPGFAVVRNAASSRSQGVELESQWAPVEMFRLTANVTYLDSTYRDFANASPNSLQQATGIKVQDLSGAATAYSPKWSGSLSALVTVPVASEWKLSGELSPFYSSSYIVLPGEAPTTQGSYVRWDARVSLESPSRRWAFDVIGKNLSDKTILAFATAYPTSVGSYLFSKQQTRSVAAQVRYKW